MHISDNIHADIYVSDRPISTCQLGSNYNHIKGLNKVLKFGTSFK